MAKREKHSIPLTMMTPNDTKPQPAQRNHFHISIAFDPGLLVLITDYIEGKS
jgi:hypothetical protein